MWSTAKATAAVLALVVPLAAAGALANTDLPESQNDYPTVARADYVFGCMAANGQTRDALERCSCSIDVIATIMPYSRYVEAEATLRLRRVSGEKGTVFRTGAMFKDIVATLKRAQAEAEIRCF